MNKKENLHLSVRQYHAVNSADIEIGDITVLAGINASGKSTLAHLFHSIVNSGAAYDTLAQLYAFHQAEKLMNALSNLMRRVRMHIVRTRRNNASTDDSFAIPYSLWHFLDEPGVDMSLRIDRMVGLVSKVTDYLVSRAKQPGVDRYVEAFSSEMELKYKLSVEDIGSFVFGEFQRIQSLYEKALASRTSKSLRYSSAAIRKWLLAEGVVSLAEGQTTILSWKNDGAYDGPVGEILSVSKAIYIESPWRSIPVIGNKGYLSVQDELMMPPPDNPFLPDQSLFEALQGVISSREESVSADESNEDWKYTRIDGRQFNLSDCATGIKAFSILSILYQRGLLDGNTLLILDEPEAHLHPQWIFEYAKVLVRLNKKLGVRILVTTHSPDMLNALKRVADVDSVSDLKFYLANETSPESFMYDYEPLERDVEKIFAKFNYAMDMTDLYEGARL